MTVASYKPGQKVPLAALRMSAGAIEIGTKTADGQTVPVTIYARSLQPVDHWYFGRIVHDMEGMRAAERISLDYCHNDAEIVGFSDKYEIDTERGLKLSAQLTPFHDKDRASEIIHKSKLGVPYEGSIFFDPDELVLEFVPEGFSTPVNGYQFEGPGVVAREWLLRNCAICPNGQDRNTAVEFSAHSQKEVEIRTMPVGKAKQSKLSKKAAPKAKAKAAAAKLAKQKGPQGKVKTKLSAASDEEEEQPAEELEENTDERPDEEAAELEEAAPRKVSCPNCDHEFEVADEAEGEDEAVELAEGDEGEAPADDDDEDEPTGDTKLTNKRSGKAFLSAFGKDGAVWFAQGKTFEQAQTLFNQKLREERQRLQKENSELKSKLTKSRGERKPLSFSSGEEGTSPDGKAVAGLSKGLSKFAASIRLPSRGKK